MPPSVHSDVKDELKDNESQLSEESSSSKFSKSSDTNDSASEVWDETETQSSLSENESDADDSNRLTAVKQLHYTVCLLHGFSSSGQQSGQTWGFRRKNLYPLSLLQHSMGDTGQGHVSA